MDMERDYEQLERENADLNERLKEMEGRMAELIEMLEQTLQKAERSAHDIEILENRCFELGNENQYLLNALQNMRDSYLNLFKAHDYTQAESRELRRILKSMKGFSEEADFELWLESVMNQEVEEEFQA